MTREGVVCTPGASEGVRGGLSYVHYEAAGKELLVGADQRTVPTPFPPPDPSTDKRPRPLIPG